MSLSPTPAQSRSAANGTGVAPGPTPARGGQASVRGRPGRARVGASGPGRVTLAAIGVVSVIAVVALWELLTATKVVSTLFLPSPGAVVRAGITESKNGQLLRDIYTSGEEFLLGLALAAAAGVPCGLIVGWSKIVSAAVWPLLMFLNAVPFIALTPILIIAFGLGMASKVALVFIGAFLVIAINTTSGVRNLDEEVLRVARMLGARRWQMFVTIAIPGSLPFILTGVRLGVGLSLIGIVVGELLGAHAGIGLMIANAGDTFQIPIIFLGVIILGIGGIVFTQLVSLLERRVRSWRL